MAIHRRGKTEYDVNAHTRAIQAIHLRAQRLTYDEIAARCGYSNAGAAQKAVRRELDKRTIDAVDTLRREELAMLDQLHVAVWPHAIGAGGEKLSLFAVDRVLAIAERRAKLLGLDMLNSVNVAAAQVIIRRYDADIDAV